MRENIDTDLHPTREAAIAAALEDMDGAGTLTICRGDWNLCPEGREGPCEACARVTVTPDLTAEEALAQAAKGLN